jgi:hypothetical protein
MKKLVLIILIISSFKSFSQQNGNIFMKAMAIEKKDTVLLFEGLVSAFNSRTILLSGETQNANIQWKEIDYAYFSSRPAESLHKKMVENRISYAIDKSLYQDIQPDPATEAEPSNKNVRITEKVNTSQNSPQANEEKRALLRFAKKAKTGLVLQGVGAVLSVVGGLLVPPVAIVGGVVTIIGYFVQTASHDEIIQVYDYPTGG